MKVTFWGVRGSIPAPGPETVKVGGNTSCTEIRTPDGDLLILDAGTGIRPLGLHLSQIPRCRLIGHIFLSHTHWDHIQGLPFFEPAHRRGNRFTILGEKRVNERLEQVLAAQYMDTYLPFSLREMQADILIKEMQDGETVLLGENTSVTALRGEHPGGVFVYRLCWHDCCVVYATDVRHPSDGLDTALIHLARGADLLIHDAHFTPEQVRAYPHFGHSSWLQAVKVAQAARVKRLALFHHRPTASDEELQEVERRAQEIFPPAFISREGFSLDLLASAASQTARPGSSRLTSGLSSGTVAANDKPVRIYE
ncbi:MAG: MBL fold metallo-hydrolase [Chloroflexia bacterium]|nr:MBL fold metallo-hydrolase [Chloroflexia bacterium]